MLACMSAANIMDKAGRAAGHRFTPCSREELKKLQALAPRLRELGVERIVCSDLDAQAGEALGRRLNVPVEEWESLRRFNVGKHHGRFVADVDAVRERIADRTVPVKGGDSRASFEKRMAAAQQRLASAPHNTLVIADEDVLVALTGASGAQRYHIYELEVASGGQSDQAEAVAAASV